jgi:hypothetical protein
VPPTPPAWFTLKRYSHFDKPFSAERAVPYVTDPNRIARHAFYPLIRYSLITNRIKHKKDNIGNRVIVRDPKSRPISYPCHLDGLIYSYYKTILSPLYEDVLGARNLKDSVTAFRKTRLNSFKLAHSAIEFIKAMGDCDIVATDLTQYYQKIDHSQLLNRWKFVLNVDRLPDDHFNVYRSITRFSYVWRYKLHNRLGLPLPPPYVERHPICSPSEFRSKIVPSGIIINGTGRKRGIPQGSSLSPLLSNIYLLDEDLFLNNKIETMGGKYWRYCDDILAVVPRGRGAEALVEIKQQMRNAGLALSLKKTNVIRTYGNDKRYIGHKPFQYLGLNFDGSDVWIRSSSIHGYKRKARKSLTAAKRRRHQETEARTDNKKAPLRVQSLKNMFSGMPIRGAKIRKRNKHREYSGTFISYMSEVAEFTGSKRIQRQRDRIVRKFRQAIRAAK